MTMIAIVGERVPDFPPPRRHRRRHRPLRRGARRAGRRALDRHRRGAAGGRRDLVRARQPVPEPRRRARRAAARPRAAACPRSAPAAAASTCCSSSAATSSASPTLSTPSTTPTPRACSSLRSRCEVAGRTMHVTLDPASRLYGGATDVSGAVLLQLRPEPGVPRAARLGGLPHHGRRRRRRRPRLRARRSPVLLATLFVPQMRSEPGAPASRGHGVRRRRGSRASMSR